MELKKKKNGWSLVTVLMSIGLEQFSCEMSLILESFLALLGQVTV